MSFVSWVYSIITWFNIRSPFSLLKWTWPSLYSYKRWHLFTFLTDRLPASPQRLQDLLSTWLRNSPSSLDGGDLLNWRRTGGFLSLWRNLQVGLQYPGRVTELKLVSVPFLPTDHWGYNFVPSLNERGVPLHEEKEWPTRGHPLPVSPRVSPWTGTTPLSITLTFQCQRPKNKFLQHQ